MKAKIGALLAAAAAAASTAGAATWAKRKRNGKQVDRRVTEAAPTASAGASTKAKAEPKPESKPASPAPPPVGTDDLTAIKGLGKVKAGRLVSIGITTYAQIAAWTDQDIAEVGLEVNTSPGQIKREDWVGQAQAKLDA
jgi:large subunit ribosomal protein L21